MFRLTLDVITAQINIPIFPLVCNFYPSLCIYGQWVLIFVALLSLPSFALTIIESSWLWQPISSSIWQWWGFGARLGRAGGKEHGSQYHKNMSDPIPSLPGHPVPFLFSKWLGTFFWLSNPTNTIRCSTNSIGAAAWVPVLAIRFGQNILYSNPKEKAEIWIYVNEANYLASKGKPMEVFSLLKIVFWPWLRSETLQWSKDYTPCHGFHYPCNVPSPPKKNLTQKIRTIPILCVPCKGSFSLGLGFEGVPCYLHCAAIGRSCLMNGRINKPYHWK